MANQQILSIEESQILIGGRIFFDNMGFSITQGQKIALVGKNGAGKTTLMNMISGHKELDSGNYWTAPKISIGYMHQHIQFKKDYHLVRDYVFSNNDKDSQDYLIDMVLSPLSLTADMELTNLSGGQLQRVSLAQALISQPDILLLDEPTNHMDLDIIQWLEGYIQAYTGAVICISHDRRFLEEISDKVFWLDRGKLRISPEGFKKFNQWSQELIDHEARALHNRQKQVDMEMSWANRGVKARVKRNVRRLRQAHDDKKQLERDISQFRRIHASLKLPPLKAEQSSQILAEFFSCHKTFFNNDNALKILNNFNFRIMKNERIGIIGKNGSGKSSFLKLLTKDISVDQGKVKLAKNMTISYFDQHRKQLDLNKTIQKNLCVSGNDHLMVRGKMRHVCSYIKDFMFDPHDAWRPVGSLSGGQINRLMLAKTLANPGALLILDEPTNDLDMDMLDMLQNILLQYQGTVIIVSHDRDFLDNVVDKLLIFEGDGIIEGIIGGYSDYEAYCQAKVKQEKHKKTTKKIVETKSSNQSLQKNNHVTQQSSLSFAQTDELKKLPNKIAELEKHKKELEVILADNRLYMDNPKKFDNISTEFTKISQELDKHEERWLYLMDLNTD